MAGSGRRGKACLEGRHLRLREGFGGAHRPHSGGQLWGGCLRFPRFSTPERLGVFELLRDRKPSRTQIKYAFGNWFGALISSGVLEGDSQKMERGIRSLASDGHICTLAREQSTTCSVPPESNTRVSHAIPRETSERIFKWEIHSSNTLASRATPGTTRRRVLRGRSAGEMVSPSSACFLKTTIDSAKLLGTLRLAASDREPVG